jgi:flagellar hook-length control protein FliK
MTQTATSPGFASLTAANAGDPAVSTPDGPNAMAAAARVLSASNTGGRFNVVMQIHPPELGQVKLNIQMHQQSMVLHIEVQSRAVAKLVESRLGELRDSLAVHGVRIDRTDVVVRTPASAEAELHQQHGQTGGDASGQSSDDALENDARSHDGRSARSSQDPGSDRADPQPAREDEASNDIFMDPEPNVGVPVETRTTELSLDLVA